MKKIIDHLRLEWHKYLLEILVITNGILRATDVIPVCEERAIPESQQVDINA